MITIILNHHNKYAEVDMPAMYEELQLALWKLGLERIPEKYTLQDLEATFRYQSPLEYFVLRLLEGEMNLLDAMSAIYTVIAPPRPIMAQVQILSSGFQSITELRQEIDRMIKSTAQFGSTCFFPVQGWLVGLDGEMEPARDAVMLQNAEVIGEAVQRMQSWIIHDMALCFADTETNAEESLFQKILSARWSVEMRGRKLYGRIDLLLTEDLTPEEQEALEEKTRRITAQDMALRLDRWSVLTDTPMPREVIRTFNEKFWYDPREATDWYYKFSSDTDYIRRYRIAKDMRWKYTCEYGDLDITINLSKPEKDPKAIAAAKNAPQSNYPKCQLCIENEGYAGRINHPARENHRIIPIEIAKSDWCLQYSPYVYYNEHCIVFNAQHVPMKIDRSAFEKLLDFVTLFPHYFVGSNADLPIVGGSILSHEHFQGGHYRFAMESAGIERELFFDGFEDIHAEIVKWPMSVIRLNGRDPKRIAELADKVLTVWRGYSDESVGILAYSDGEPHNTITPIARRRSDLYELDLVLRCNITTEEHPLGVFHPHADKHHIKKENIGLIEVMGLAVLPSRLKQELHALAEAVVSEADITADEVLCKHAQWVEELKQAHTFTKENAMHILMQETGRVFAGVLEDAGVYKNNAAGRNAFARFVDFVNHAGSVQK